MSAGSKAWWARSLAALAAAEAVATLVLVVLTRDQPDPRLTRSHVEDALLALAFLGYSLVGALLVARRPGNRVGRVFLAGGLLLQTWALATKYALYGLRVSPGALPGDRWAAWVASWIVLPAFAVAFGVLFLLVPDGRLPSPRWRPAARAMAVGLPLATLTWALEPGSDTVFPEAGNPIAVGLLRDVHLSGIGWLILLASVITSATALVVRVRRSRGVVRRQVQWFAYAAGVVVVAWVSLTLAAQAVPGAAAVAQVALPLAVAGVPVAAAIAVFRHNLYDIELVVSRTVTLAALAILLTGLYAAVVVGLGRTVAASTRPDPLVPVLATAAVAVAFEPLRRRLRRWADRLVYGERTTPYELLAGISAQMATAPADLDVLPELARTLAAGTASASASVWLVVDGRLRPAGCWPDADRRPDVEDVAELRAVLPPRSEVVEVRYRGDLLGALTLTPVAADAISPATRRLLADVAAQAALLLRNVHLIEELKSSRQRIVTAQDRERRRIERDIHDGVQQRLVSLAMALRMARGRLRPDVDGAVSSILEAAGEEARQTLTDLRELARGIHPAVLTEGGLGPALESLAERAPLPVRLVGIPGRRLPAPVEAAVYFTVAEALTNTAKHAQATEAVVRVDCDAAGVRVEIADDGRGGAAGAAGSGLVGLMDRVATVEGVVHVDSPRGRGTKIRLEVPCASS